MKIVRSFCLVLALAFGLIPVFSSPAHAQGGVIAISIHDQVVVDGTVNIAMAEYFAPSFMVIYADNGGNIGPMIGYRQLSVGMNTNVQVWIDAAQATPTLHAMLHMDTGEIGVYEFGTDGPVTDPDGEMMISKFKVTVLNVKDQLPGDSYTAASVTVERDAWLVIHSDAANTPGPVLGQTFVKAGTTANVEVPLAAEGRTDVLWPMLHMDTHTPEVYDFGTVEGADAPIVVNDVMAMAPIWTVAHVRALPQIVTYGDVLAATMENQPSTFTVASVLATEPGFIVIHSEADGQPGPVAGYAPVPIGLSENIGVELDPAIITPTLWPMLHVDTGEAGVYEFGTVDDADGPVMVNGDMLTFSVMAAPNIDYVGVFVDESTLKFSTALVDSPTWLVIHREEGGGLGAVIGQTLLVPGLNQNVIVKIDTTLATPTLFPMFHYDTGTPNVYEFGVVTDADGPVRVNNVVIKGTFVELD